MIHYNFEETIYFLTYSFLKIDKQMVVFFN